MTKKKKKEEIDPFLDTVCPLRASLVKKRNRPVFRHGMPLQGIPRKKAPLIPRGGGMGTTGID